MLKTPMIVLLFSATVLSATAQEFTRPISNPVFTDVPEATTMVRPLFIYQTLPSKISVNHPELGKVELPVDGDFQVYALQFEIGLTEDLSIIAVKDGFIDYNPDDTLSEESGIADLGAGLKYVFYRDGKTAASARFVYEAPIGDDEVWQGNGDGTLNPGVSVMTLAGNVQLGASIGYIQALDTDEESSMFYDSWHVSMPVCSYFTPMVELNHFHVTDTGAGVNQFSAHAGGAVPAIARFEGGDLVNFGAANSDDNPDIVTLAIGGRVKLTDELNLGAAFEFPLTDEEANLMDTRTTVDLVYTF